MGWPLKILFCLSGMGAGGAERQASLICNHWARTGHEVILVNQFDLPSHYDLERNISRRALRASTRRSQTAALNDIRMMRRLVRAERPHVVIAFIDIMNIKTLLATLGVGVPVVISERVNPTSLAETYPSLLATAVAIARRITYPFSTALVVQTEAAARWGRAGRFSSRVEIIPNVVLSPDETERGQLPASDRTVLSVGRLCHQKGHDILIRAFASLAARFPGWRLKIVGEGDLREELSRLVGSLGMTDRIELAPVQKSLAHDYRAAGVFVLASRFEGFPNTLLEAMQMGCAVLAADCPTGPREVITDGSDGLLFRNGDAPDLASKLATLMNNGELRRSLGNRARSAVEKYRPEVVLPLWDRLLQNLPATR